MKLNIFLIFSELVAGIAFIALIFLYYFMFVPHKINWVIAFKTNCSALTFSHLLSISVIIYFIGFVIDGIGLGLDEIVFNKLLLKERIDKNRRKSFFKNVSEHVLEYRNRQWSYYSCYRNLFLLIFPTLFIVPYFVSKTYGWLQGIGAGCLILALECIVYRTMKMLIKLYYSIEKSFEEQ